MILWLSHKWDHLENVVVEHKNNKSACLAQENRIWRLFLVMKDLFANVATTHNFNFVFISIVANQGNSEVGKHNEQVIWCVVSQIHDHRALRAVDHAHRYISYLLRLLAVCVLAISRGEARGRLQSRPRRRGQPGRGPDHCRERIDIDSVLPRFAVLSEQHTQGRRRGGRRRLGVCGARQFTRVSRVVTCLWRAPVPSAGRGRAQGYDVCPPIDRRGLRSPLSIKTETEEPLPLLVGPRLARFKIRGGRFVHSGRRDDAGVHEGDSFKDRGRPGHGRAVALGAAEDPGSTRKNVRGRRRRAVHRVV